MAEEWSGHFSPPGSSSDDGSDNLSEGSATNALRPSPAAGPIDRHPVNGHAMRLGNGTRGRAEIDDEKKAPVSPEDWEEHRPGGRDMMDEDDEEGLVLAEDPAEASTWSSQASIKGGSEIMRMVLLSFNAVGMTFTWGVEMTYCTPYLLSLGLTKGQTSMVWIAGPLSGLIVQPIVGAISDNSTSKWGRRRPIIVFASILVTFSLLTLGFTKEIVGVIIKDKDLAKTFTIIFAVIALYATDFSINAVMSCSRSLVVDTLPAQKQQAGAAWGSRMSSIGHITGYGLGALDLVKIFGTSLGDTQFKKLTIIAALGMLISSGITCWAVTEKVYNSESPQLAKSQGRFKVVRQIWSTLRSLPPRIQAICWAVFWSWIGWFPFLIYSSTWVGETYFRYDVPDNLKDSKDALGEMGRIGSTALTVYSVVTFISAWVLPLFVRAPDDDEDRPDRIALLLRLMPASMTDFAERLKKAKPDLLTAWFISNLMFAGAMSMAPFAASFRFATVLVAICGLPWTIAMWAPAAFLGVEVNKLSGSGDSSNGAALATSYRRLSGGSAIEMRETSSRLESGSQSPASTGEGELSGIYFGILNIYTTLPQFIGTFISTIVFAILEPGKSPELATDAHPSEHHSTTGPNGIAVCLFIGAISAIGAAYATRRLRYIP